MQRQPILNDLVKKQAETIQKLEAFLADKQRELDLEKRENEINQRIQEVQRMEIEHLKEDFNRMKDIADRAIKLAEISKPKSNWQLMGLLGVAAFVIGCLVGK